MKTGDLQLGDWVRLAYDKKAVRVKAIFRLGVYTDYEGESLNGSYTDFEIEPIRLTTDILKKNGFYYGILADEESIKAIHISKRWIYDNEDSITIELFYPTKSDGGWQMLSLLKNRFYVHELQHCLRLCGLNELANNFKV